MSDASRDLEFNDNGSPAVPGGGGFDPSLEQHAILLQEYGDLFLVGQRALGLLAAAYNLRRELQAEGRAAAHRGEPARAAVAASLVQAFDQAELRQNLTGQGVARLPEPNTGETPPESGDSG